MDDLLKRTEEFLRNEAAVTGPDACIIAQLGDAVGLLNEWAVKKKKRRTGVRWCEHIYLEDDPPEEGEGEKDHD